MHTSLTAVLNAARTAIINRVEQAVAPEHPGNSPRALSMWQAQTRSQNAARAASLDVLKLSSDIGLPPSVVLKGGAKAPALETLTDLSALKDGPQRLLTELHAIGLHVIAAKARPFAPNQVVFHASQELLAAALGVHRITVWRWTAALKELGLIDTRAHISSTTHKGETVSRIDGLVVAVSLKRDHTARLRYEDLKHKYRDLDADRKAGNTAFSAVQQSGSLTALERSDRLKRWAVNPAQLQNPLENTDCCSVLDVVYRLPLLVTASHNQRCALIDQFSGTLAGGFNDQQSKRFYARLLWEAVEAEKAGLAALQPLGAQLLRLRSDCKEWSDLKRPGAVLAVRLKRSA